MALLVSPAGQLMQMGAFTVALTKPVAQGVQTRLLVVVGAMDWASPGLQSGRTAMHIRSLVEVGAADSY